MVVFEDWIVDHLVYYYPQFNIYVPSCSVKVINNKAQNHFNPGKFECNKIINTSNFYTICPCTIPKNTFLSKQFKNLLNLNNVSNNNKSQIRSKKSTFNIQSIQNYNNIAAIHSTTGFNTNTYDYCNCNLLCQNVSYNNYSYPYPTIKPISSPTYNIYPISLKPFVNANISRMPHIMTTTIPSVYPTYPTLIRSPSCIFSVSNLTSLSYTNDNDYNISLIIIMIL